MKFLKRVIILFIINLILYKLFTNSETAILVFKAMLKMWYFWLPILLVLLIIAIDEYEPKSDPYKRWR